MAGKYQTYPEYKNSRIDWMGEIPRHWETIAVGRLFTRVKRTGHSDKELLSVYRDFGVIPKSSRDDNNNKPSEDLDPYQLVRPNDLVMNKMKAWQGSIAMSVFEGIVSPAYFVYQPNPDVFSRIHPKYLHYLLRSPRYITQYLRRSKGIRVNQWDLDPDEFKRIDLLIPPRRDEQEQIADFLDHETAKIDTLIDKQQQLIKLLKEKRQAVISHAVTKGLNPDAPMKDSGVEWLGVVPEHWTVAKLRYLVTESAAGPYGASLTKAMYTSSGYRVYGQQQVIAGCFEVGDYYISQEKYIEMIRYRVFPGDLLVTVMGTIGRVAVVPEGVEKGIINPRLVRYALDKKRIIPEFAKEQMLSSLHQNYLLKAAQGSTMDGLNMGILGGLPLAYPPYKEQQEVLNYVDKISKKYSQLIFVALQSLDLLRERRTALISSAVTGKIDVRNWKTDFRTE
nr:restriction endonuclease subunit S [uncultured Desulfuromonas sp.]